MSYKLQVRQSKELAKAQGVVSEPGIRKSPQGICRIRPEACGQQETGYDKEEEKFVGNDRDRVH